MTIPESQLETWSHQGSVSQSADTYEPIKRVLEDRDAPYANRSFETFLQGSYRNTTNVWSESDVDVVINLKDVYYSGTESLSAEDKARFDADFVSSSYSISEFKASVTGWLKQKFGSAVDASGGKAVAIAGNGSRRDADVIISAQYRLYTSYKPGDVRFYEGIMFLTKQNERIINYPKLHAEHMTIKHQATGGWLKPTVRIFKNLRNRLVEWGDLEDGVAPSYYIEGLLYNVPADRFGVNYQDTFTSVYDYIANADRSKFVCANERYYLLWPDSPVTWRAENCDRFLAAVRNAWIEWS